MTADLTQVRWMLSRLPGVAAGIRETVAVSGDGRLLAASPHLSRADADRLTAVTCALASLARGAGDGFDLGRANHVTVSLSQGHLLVSVVNPFCRLGILATDRADLATIGSDLAAFANQIKESLTESIVDGLAATFATEQ
jgi:predicted regulator of Ras-like GTPase activity (Roadblock/LC7/MglB family)